MGPLFFWWIVMLPGDFLAVSAALLAIVPGFVATVAWARARTWKGVQGDLRTVLQSLALSAVIQLVLSPLTIWWILPIRRNADAYPVRLTVWFALAVIVIPVSGGIGAARLGDALSDIRSAEVTGRLRRAIARVWPAAAPPSIWDWVFTVRPPHGSFLVVEFRDGRRVAGVFAEGSMAITSPEARGLFLVSESLVDDEGDIVGEIPDSAGIMISSADDVRSVRVLRGGTDGR